MRRSLKAILLVVAMAASVLVATRVQAQDPSGGSAPVATQAPTPQDTGAGITETEFVPISPCRIYDTRAGQGGSKVAGSTFRILKVRGPEDFAGQFAAQGGRSGGCGVPSSAAAIEATVHAVNPVTTGILRLWPSGQPETTSTFLNYIRGFNPTNTGALAICNVGCGAASDLRVRAYGGATHVVIEVQGYYIKPLAAVVSSTGALVRGSRVVSTVRQSTGQFRVQFDRTVDQCVTSAAVDGTSGNAYAMVGPDSADSTRVYVFISDANGSLVNRSFHVTLTC